MAATSDPHLLAHQLIARYLRERGYDATLAAFESDAEQVGQAGLLSASDDDLLSVTEAYLSRQTSLQKKSSDEEEKEKALSILTQSLPGPSTLEYKSVHTHGLLHTSNILSIKHAYAPRKWFDTAIAEYRQEHRRCLLTTAADKRIVFCDPEDGDVIQILEGDHKAAVLDVAQVEGATGGSTSDWPIDSLPGRLLASAGMDGSVILYDALSGKHLQTLRNHAKFVVRVAFNKSGTMLASAGYDRRINFYQLKSHGFGDDGMQIEFELLHSVELPTNPETLLFLPNSGASERDWLVYTRRGDNFVHYVALPSSADAGSPPTDDAENKLANLSLTEEVQDWDDIRYNTNPTSSDMHVSYSILDVSLHPSGKYLSLQTGDHAMSSSITQAASSSASALSRILLFPLHSDQRAATLWTGAACSAYASPRHAWLPSGRGVWVNGEDGVLRLVDLQGKTRASLPVHGVSDRSGEMDGSVSWSRGGGGNTVIKDLVALDEETLASCGFDKTVRITRLVTA